MVEGLSLLGGGRAGGPAIQAVSGLTRAASPTSLLKVGPTGSTQSATDLVKLGGGRMGVRAGAGLALSDLTLFAGTPQEITAKVLTQPTLEVLAGGDEKHSRVTYRPAVLSVRSGGRLVESLDGEHADVSLSLLGRLAADRPASLLSVRLSLGTPTQKVDGASVSGTSAPLVRRTHRERVVSSTVMSRIGNRTLSRPRLSTSSAPRASKEAGTSVAQR